jgi:hypothetical protein
VKRKPIALAVREHAPWMPVEFTEEEAGAIKCLQRGDAPPHVQQLALKCIVERICDTYGMGWHPASPHEASFAAGRRFAGLQVVKALNVDIKLFKRGESSDG